MAGFLRGEVTDNADPMQRGRVRVFVWGMHQEKDPNLPWAEVMGSTFGGLNAGVGSSSVLQVGTSVWVTFEQDDLNCPIVVGVFQGHAGGSLSEANKDNSDLHGNTKNDAYGQNWTFTTPGGHYIEINDYKERIEVRTADGYELVLDDKNQKLRLGTPCCQELTMNCLSGMTKWTNGMSSITLQGTSILLNGFVYSPARIDAPNLVVTGYTGSVIPEPCSPGLGGLGGNAPPGTGSTRQQQENQENACNPINADGKSSCQTNFPPMNDETLLEPDMKKVLDRAREILGNLSVYETKMSANRYVCLKKSGINPIELAQVYGYAVDFDPNPIEGTTDEDVERTTGCYSDKNDLVKVPNEVCYSSDNPEIRALTRMIFFEIRGGTQDQKKSVVASIFNSLKLAKPGNPNYLVVYQNSNQYAGTIAGREAGYLQYSYVGYNGKRTGPYSTKKVTEKSAWQEANDLAVKWYTEFKNGTFKDPTGGAESYLHAKSGEGNWTARMNGYGKGTNTSPWNVSEMTIFDGNHIFFKLNNKSKEENDRRNRATDWKNLPRSLA